MNFKFQSLAYLFIAGLIGFTSCKKDDETKLAPKITINSSSISTGTNPTSGTANVGDSVSITVTFEATEKLKTIQGFLNGTKIDEQTSGFDSDTKHTETWDVPIPAGATGPFALKFVVTDKSNGTSEKTFTVNIGDLNSWSAKLLGGQTNRAGSYFASSNGLVYQSADAQAQVGIVDVTYAAIGATASPTILSWKFRGDASTGLEAAVPAGALETKFAATTLTASDFIAANSSSEAKYKSGIDGVTAASGQSVVIEAGKVYAFLSGTKKGLIHIAAITPGVAGSVNINVKVQK